MTESRISISSGRGLHRRSTARWLAGALLALLALPLAPTAGAATHPAMGNPGTRVGDVPTGEATIHGRVLLDDGSKAPVEGASVALYALVANGHPGIRRMQSAADGSFQFSKISGEPSTIYLLGARYQGIAFPGARIQFSSGDLEREVKILVSAPSTDVAAIDPIPETEIHIEWKRDRIEFTETHKLTNRGQQVVNIPKGKREGVEPPFHTKLPAGAVHFNMPFDVIPEGIERVGDDVRFWGPFYAGEQDLTFSYELPIQLGKSIHLRKEFPTGAKSVTIVFPEEGLRITPDQRGVALESEPLSKQSKENDRHGLQSLFAENLSAGQEVAFQIEPLQSTSDPAASRLEEVSLILDFDQVSLHVSEQYQFAVSGNRYVAGTKQAPVLTIPLPKDATNIQFSENLHSLGLSPRPRNGSLTLSGPFPPGETLFQIAYVLPTNGNRIDLTRSFGKKVSVLNELIADTQLTATSPRLHNRRAVRLDDGRTYLYREGFQIEAGENVTLQLTRLPARKSLPRAAQLSAAFVLSLGVALFLLAPLQQRRQTAPEEVGPSESERERQRLYASIRDLDEDFDGGKLSPADYHTLRNKLRAQAIALLQAEQAEK